MSFNKFFTLFQRKNDHVITFQIESFSCIDDQNNLGRFHSQECSLEQIEKYIHLTGKFMTPYLQRCILCTNETKLMAM